MMVCKMDVSSEDNICVTLTCSGAFVITRSRMLFPRVGVLLSWSKC